ncbi:hypothetical protein [Chitinimonas lacunae]|uniref:Uncharacterized protein n=1 Tax=Chitinimonas lacunae TaxID=1963018 RepID=A0ABV8MQW1_9NEIS
MTQAMVNAPFDFGIDAIEDGVLAVRGRLQPLPYFNETTTGHG